MSALLYDSIFSNLTQAEINEIDMQVSNNRKKVCSFVINLGSNLKGKATRVTVIIVLASKVGFGKVESADAIGISVLPERIEMINANHHASYEDNYYYSLVRTARMLPGGNNLTGDNFQVCKELAARELMALMYLMDPKTSLISGNEHTLSVIKKLRGGSWGILGAVFIFAVVAYMTNGFTVIPNLPSMPGSIPGSRPGLIRPDPFQPNQYRDEWQTPRNPYYRMRRPFGSQPKHPSTLQITRPTVMPHEEFSSLTKAERRALPHKNDMTIIAEGYPELHVGFYQSKYKVGKHGAIHGLPYEIKPNGGTKTEKTDENTLAMMESIVQMPNRRKVKWFKNGIYQGGTDREFEAIHIYDPETQVIAVFNKSTGKFVTTCLLTPGEVAELKETGNFGGGAEWFSKKVRNLPPEQTMINSFQSDVMGIPPEQSANEGFSPVENEGFTPINTFESDVCGITPINPSEFNSP